MGRDAGRADRSIKNKLKAGAVSKDSRAAKSGRPFFSDKRKTPTLLTESGGRFE